MPRATAKFIVRKRKYIRIAAIIHMPVTIWDFALKLVSVHF